MDAALPHSTLELARGLIDWYRSVRQQTHQLTLGLSEADATVQSMPDASPTKWHLAHTSWFFEAMVLARHARGYSPFDARYEYLFNSYYETIGPRHARPKRGLLTRPALAEVLAYRRYIDDAVEGLLREEVSPEVTSLIELGCHHEQQHQELLLTDILHLFSENPLSPGFTKLNEVTASVAADAPSGWTSFEGGIVEIGHDGEGFAFDCEGPRHEVLLRPYRLRHRCVTNGEWLAFIADGGYSNPLLWLSDGWEAVQRLGWASPLYWRQEDGECQSMTLGGLRAVESSAPVSHISYFEADAFARWMGKRLPTEAEWEIAAQGRPQTGNFADSGLLRPIAAPRSNGLTQLYGDVWEWTCSAFSPYPGFQELPGAAGEYNGKFMSGQYTLRGGSCATPADHIRPSYRNFFKPETRWQFAGMRLAENG